MGEKYKNIHQELIDECRNGNTKAQFELYKLYYKAMYNTSLRLVNDGMEAEDIMQEAFLRAFKNINTYKEEVSFGAWLKKIVVNRSLDFLKKRKLETGELDEGRTVVVDENNDEDLDDQLQKVAEIKQAIAQLSDKYRVIVTLHLIEGYDHEEISQILDIPIKTSRTHLRRGKLKLQDLLKPNYNAKRY